jgi:hypothetical protein
MKFILLTCRINIPRKYNGTCDRLVGNLFMAVYKIKDFGGHSRNPVRHCKFKTMTTHIVEASDFSESTPQ